MPTETTVATPILMFYKSFSFWLWLTFFTITTLILATTPLFNILAFEFCAALTICVAFACAHIAMTVFQKMKRNPDNMTGSGSKFILLCFWHSIKANVVLLLVPLFIIIINAFRVKNCNFGEGLLFFLLLPTLSCFTTTAAGLFFSVWIQKRWIAYLTYLGFLFLSCFPVVINLIFHPPVFAFHPVLGYFPGPIYDFIISITNTLLIARGQTLLWGLLFLSLATIGCEISRSTGLIPRLKWHNFLQWRTTNSIWSITTVLLLILAVISLELLSGKLGIRPTRNDIEHALGGYRETPHFEIYYATELESEIDLFADDCEFRYKQLSEYLETENSRKIRAYLYVSPAQKKQLIGAGNTFVEDPFGYGFHLHTQGFPHPVLKHELAHVLTADWSPWKVSLNVGVHEGIAVAADWDEGKLTVHQWAKAMRQLNVAPSLSSVMSIGFWKHAGSRSYLLAGSFIRFLVDRYGLDDLKRGFPFGNISKSYMKDLTTLEEEWVNYLVNEVQLDDRDKAYAELRLSRGGIFEQVCAHEMAALRNHAWKAYNRKDYATALNTFHKMLSDEPDNPRTHLGLMYSSYRMGDYKQSTIFANELIRNANSQYRTQASQLLGDVHWLQGNLDRALEIYKDAVVLATHETIELNILKRITTLSSKFSAQSKDLLKTILVPSTNANPTGNATKMAILSQIIGAEPKEWLVYYLAGEILHNEKAWKLSSQYLHHALALGSESENGHIPGQFKTKSQRMLGINAYNMKDYGVAEQIFKEITRDETLSLGTILNATYWINRCQWAKQR